MRTTTDSTSRTGPGGAPGGQVWVDVCALDDIVPNRGVCALVGSQQVAIFRVAPDDQLFALSNYDPFSRAFVLSRGILGSKGDRLKVTSPVYKQGFDLRTGESLEDQSVTVAVFEVRVVDGNVQVALP